MLSTAKAKLKTDLYKCFLEAYAKQYMETQGVGYADLNAQISAQIAKSGHTFANKISSGMADAIYDFVKEIGINITVPPTVMCGPTPCTGTIPMTNVKVS